MHFPILSKFETELIQKSISQGIALNSFKALRLFKLYSINTIYDLPRIIVFLAKLPFSEQMTDNR